MESPDVLIRPALKKEADLLSEIMFVSKFYWDYPEEYKIWWKEELTIKPEMLEQQDFYVAEIANEIAGFYSTIENAEDYYVGALLHPKGLWLENMFIHPKWIGKGIGNQMMHHLLTRCKENGIEKFCFYADPNATGFYEKYGGQMIGAYPSSIPERLLPLYELKIGSI